MVGICQELSGLVSTGGVPCGGTRIPSHLPYIMELKIDSNTYPVVTDCGTILNIIFMVSMSGNGCGSRNVMEDTPSERASQWW